MNKTIKTIKLVPAQGVQTELGKMFLYNASAVNRVIEQINTSEAEVLKTANDAAAAADAAAESAQSAIITFGKVKECVEKAVETVQAADVSANAAMLDAQYAAKAAAESAKTSTQNEELIQGYVKAVETSAIAANLDAASAKSSADAAAESATQANEAARRAGLKLSVVMVLPDVGDDKTIYLVPKDGERPDVHNEYVWITATQTFELIGTTQVDLTGYVKKTDYATTTVGGAIKISNYYGSYIFGDGKIAAMSASLETYKSAPNEYFIGKATLENTKNDIVKRAITENNIALTDSEKQSAQAWLGIESGDCGLIIRRL